MNEQTPAHTNSLIHSTSPYLLQHAHNPINWYEWGEEAIRKAEEESKPIFLSIGYSACHWCHVMEHESFEDEEVARVINEHFVAIKVDREERPDIDEIYMQITQAMNQGRGGWPMSLFLTPDRRPFFAGTYFPREQFLALARRVAEVWDSQREVIKQDADRARQYLAQWAKGPTPDAEVIGLDLAAEVARVLAEHFDMTRGGLHSDSNKFPPSMAMELMLRIHSRSGDASLLHPVDVTLDNIARGGIYDHLGGGICRYSTDPEWLVPHFEKMLYDQALVSSIYLDGYQVLGNDRYADVARDIFEYVLTDLQNDQGGFYSTRDADSEGLEGAYYIWTVEQVRDVLGDDADLFCAFYDVTSNGNWFEQMGHAPAGPKNILRIKTPREAFAAEHGMTAPDFENRLAGWRSQMLEARSKRTPPGLDDKCLTSWNGLMIGSLAKGARILEEPRYAKEAARTARFVLDNLQKDGRLLRTWREGQAHIPGYLDDYAFFIEGLLNLYEATFDDRWLSEAARLNDLVREQFADADQGGFFYTAKDAEELIARSKNPRDNAIPSGNSVQAMNLLRLAILLGRDEFRADAERLFRAFKPLVAESPAAFERLLCAVDFYHGPVHEVAVVGPPDSAATKELVDVLFNGYRPRQVVVYAAPGDEPAVVIPLLTSRGMVDGRPAAYVCENYACQKPVTDPAALGGLLGDAPAFKPPSSEE